MTVLTQILRTHVRNVARSRWLLGYGALLLVTTLLLIQFGGSGGRALLSLINVVLLAVPLMSVVFGTLYVYQAREFTELLLTQPVGRAAAYFGLAGGLVIPLVAAFLLSVGLPLGVLALNDPTIVVPLLTLLAVGALLVMVFVALAVAVAVSVDDRAWGLGSALLIWLFCTVIYDGIILLVLATFRDRPLEAPVLGLVMVNPIDVARIQLLLTFDVAALLGYTGTIYERVFGSGLGQALASVILAGCAAVPLTIGYAIFRKRDW